ncbi:MULTISPECIES: DUF4426 domain-containing protein [Gammaproteobacteria]|uniref:DUF4426 domain-containing protein n=1 Tax=Gammaproteobacteria TaxID=1236 RepID=UPI000DCFEDCF|nr:MULTISPECIES: DUF4426 domain-containing protein [Gammaproteobacteria]RTE87712.1 DUF4426 domain-containing protein [Aliidiomarina sp. B3213]TCZ92505.1 DUF4426 domain-containing protein [Lysobacter sp. N42]
MNFPKFSTYLLALAAVLFLSAKPTLAQEQGARFQRLGGWEVHFNTVATTFLEPSIAAQYNIRRSSARSLLNIAVLDATVAGKPAVDAEVTGSFLNVLGQRRTLNFTRVQEGEAIYFIADFGHDDDENLRFFIDIETENSSQELRFNDQFYHSIN